jgi:hypothetical protein
MATAAGATSPAVFELTNTTSTNAPVITLQPVNQTVVAGATASFTAAASGNPTPTVQWQLSTDGGVTFSDISGATADTYSFTAAASENGNEYRAVFTNSYGSATSAAATLTVNTAPVVTTNPSDQTVAAGDTATFTAAASGQPAPTVQWQVSTDGGTTFSNISGATADTYSFTATADENGDEYCAVFTNGLGSATTSAATLTVNTGPVVTTNPSDQTVNAGQTATFTAAASGQPAPTVQWQVSTDGGATFSDISGATADTYSFTAAADQNGDEYCAVFTNSVGSATSSAATMTVDSAPVVTTNPSDQTVAAGNTATFTAAASGRPAPTVQWQVSTDGGTTFSNISGATADTYSFTAAADQNGDEYCAVFTNSGGSATTSAAVLTVVQPVTITSAAVVWGTQISPPLVTQSDGLRLLPAGRSTDFPWLGIDQVPITLSQAATLTATDVTVSSDVGVNYGPVMISGSGTSYTITLAQPITVADRVTITIGNATIATFTRRLDVLPGDFNDDGVVNSQDLVGVRNEWLRINGAVPTIFGDINGDGVVNGTDYNDVRKEIGTSLPSAGPTIYTVNLTSDTGASSGTDPNTGNPSGDLLWAITQANANSNTAGTVINFDPVLFSTPQTITLSNTLTLSETAGPEVIDGPGANLVTVSGNNAVGGFFVTGGVTAAITGLTETDGFYPPYGGGIMNWGGTLTVADCTIANNSYGGISNTGTITIIDCTSENNLSAYDGGGLWNDGTMTVVNSTIADDSARQYGGGIANESGSTMTVVNCTITDDSAGSVGGGIYNAGTLTLNNTIVALNTQGTSASDIYGGVSGAYNLIGTGGSGGLVNGVNGNLVGVANPGLDPNGLQNNGGPTQTIALLPGSPAIDAASNALAVDPSTGQPLTTDQRGPGFPRIVNGTVDIGAYEVQGYWVVTTQPPASVTAGTGFGLSVTAEDTSGNGLTSFDGTVTVALSNNPGGATLGGTLSETAQSGVATFSDLTLDQPGTGYTLQVSSPGLTGATTGAFNVESNLLVNGDFSQGNTGFTSQYVYSTNLSPEGNYVVGDNPYHYFGGGASFGDHTTGTGLMLIANGSPTPNTVVWQETVNVSIATDYVFSGWAASVGMGGDGGGPFDPSPAQLEFFVNGVQIGTEFTLIAQDGDWSQFSAPWTSGTSGAVTVTIIDMNTNRAGNDFCLDDLTFGTTQAVYPQLMVTAQPPASVTAGSGFGLTVTAYDEPGQVDSSFNGSVTVALENNPGAATLGGTLTATAQSGVATFSGLTLDTAADGYTLLVSGNGVDPTTTDAFNVTAAAATQLVVATQPPGSVLAGSAFGLVVSAEDQYDNVDPTFSGSVAVALLNNPGGATLGGTLSVTAQSGVATFSDLTLNEPGIGYTLSLSSSGLTSATTDAFNVYSPTLYTVDLTSANGTGSGTAGDLVYTIGLANANPNPAGSEIQFDPTVFGSPQTITLSSTLVLSETAGPEVIDGPGASLVTVSGNHAVQVFSVASDVTASFTGLTISDGSAVYGGGIYNLGTMTVTNSAVVDNNSILVGGGGPGGRGGIANAGTMTVTNSTIDNNTPGSGISNTGTMTVTYCTVVNDSSAYAGGGLWNGAGTMTVADCTVADNSASWAGGIANYGTSLTVVNSTIAGNTAGTGAGIWSAGPLTVVNCTITGNSGGGLEGGATLDNTIVALNTGGDIVASVSSSSAYNLIGTGGSGGLVNGVNGNLVGVANPGLDPNGLQNNGGPTQTIALETGSPAIDAGSNALAVDPTTGQPLTTDQRGTGYPRIVNGTVDIGAFEYESGTFLVVTTQPPASVMAGSSFGLTVTAEDSSGNVDSSFDGTVTVALGTNPGGATLGGTLSVTAQSGVATFSGLTLNTAANGYTLLVSGNGVVPTTTDAFDVTAAAATQLVVTTQPPLGVAVGSGFGLVVSAEDPYGNVDPTFSGSVAVALLNNPGGATLGGTLSVTAQSGVATFSGLTLDQVGTGYTLQVSSNGLTSATTDAFNVQTTIATVAVGWGTQTAPLQTASDGLRLLPAGRNTDLPWLGINQLQITLAQAASLASGDVTVSSAIGADYGPVSVSGLGTSYTITLAQPINAADRVTITIGNALIFTFTRRLDVLPGDFNDGGVVNSQDMVGVRNEWLRVNGAVPTIFGDINGDGVVNGTDYNDVRKEIGTSLPPVGDPSISLGTGGDGGPALVRIGTSAPLPVQIAISAPLLVRIGTSDPAPVRIAISDKALVRIGTRGPATRKAASRAGPRAEIQLSGRGWSRGTPTRGKLVNQRLIERW